MREDAVTPGDIAVGVIIGRTSEFFDFFVYAIASVIVFPKLMFPALAPLDATLASFAIFALAFVARPVGSIWFTGIDQKYGRGVKLTIALVLLGGSTAAISFVPGRDSIGVEAVWLLALFRLGQGFAQGGTWDGLPSLLTLNVPEGRRGWYAMIPQLGAPLGLIVASLLFAFFTSSLDSADFLDWGWRYPFFCAFAINVVALFARLRIVESPSFEKLYEERDLQTEAPLRTLAGEWRTIVIGAFAPLASFALFHMVTVFPLSWVHLFTGEDPTRFLVLEAGAAMIGVIAMVASGQLADLFGRRTLLAVTALAIAVFSGFAPQLLAQGETGAFAFLMVGFVILGLSFGQSSGAVAGELPLRHRYTGAALTNDLAWLVGAGFAPLVALWVSAHYGLLASGAYLLSGALATLLALWLNRELARGI
ncbi:major facilitator superfamily sugar transporter permease [Novosphingobium nitrogenifigens DSM 19370]|uniref:Major facilitator superfamily sugar transporter permease n=1 Tax=Novosphingobium nitrogenifigens DSM 19370 TaxID=983920 RepID=F1ZDX6_9SPHN|nr:MFS transporter [Novosphingobium nitrogenifigens]EGD57187.1 major facilitator superfamily sugar transporter permease [Novosphingobium nitrogenifigens DSM 19370]